MVDRSGDLRHARVDLRLRGGELVLLLVVRAVLLRLRDVGVELVLHGDQLGLAGVELRLAGREADGAILNWLAPYDVAQCLDAVDNPAADVVARIFVCPTEDTEYARSIGRMLISTYLTVPAYAAFHDWLGRDKVLAPMHEAWARGDRAAAGAAIPEDVVDDLVLHGSPEQCQAQVQAYADAGVRTPVIALLPTPQMADPATGLDIIRRLGRSS